MQPSSQELLDAYADMIAHFHMRWQVGRLIERQYLTALLDLSPRDRASAARPLQSLVASHPWTFDLHRRLTPLELLSLVSRLHDEECTTSAAMEHER
jgi:hypothetical protein